MRQVLSGNNNPRWRLRAALAACTILSSVSGDALWAQSAGSLAPPPVRRPIDGNGVDVLRGTINVSQTDITIGGGGKHGLSYGREIIGTAWRDSFAATLTQSGSVTTVTINGESDSFDVSGSTYTATEGNGATLTFIGGVYTYTSRDGVVANFESNAGYAYTFYRSSLGRLTDLTYPDGTKIVFTYKIQQYCGSGIENGVCPGKWRNAVRVQSITNSNGYQLKFSYAEDGPDIDISTYDSWARPSAVKAVNNAVEYCDPNADSCALTGSWPTANYTRTPTGTGYVYTAADAAGRTTTYTVDTIGGLKGIKRPGAASDNVVVTYGSLGVASVVRDGVTNSYSYVDSGTTRTTTVTNPSGTQVYVGDTATYLISSYRDELNRTVSYAYDSNGRVTTITYPEGNKVQYTYDARGNAIETRVVSKSPGTPPDIVTTASFPASCGNVVTCNKPTTMTDAKGNVTDLSFDGTHGGMLSITAPAAAPGGVRPQTRFTYGTARAYYKNGSGAIVASGQNHYVLTST